MSKSIIALLLLAASPITAHTYHEITAPVYQAEMHVVYANKVWSQLENEEQVAMIQTKHLPGSTEPGTEYLVKWTTHGTDTPRDDSVISVEEVQ